MAGSVRDESTTWFCRQQHGAAARMLMITDANFIDRGLSWPEIRRHEAADLCLKGNFSPLGNTSFIYRLHDLFARGRDAGEPAETEAVLRTGVTDREARAEEEKRAKVGTMSASLAFFPTFKSRGVGGYRGS